MSEHEPQSNRRHRGRRIPQIRRCRPSTGARARSSARSSRRYLETGEPVGSRNISRILPMSLSPASVRNVMADLEQLGLIYAPHTSAGRLPTEFGLRFFVDALLEVGDLSAEERQQIEAQVKAATPGRTRRERAQPRRARRCPACRAAPAWCSPTRPTSG